MSTQISLSLASKTDLREQFRGAFIGAAIGDALGFITEFMPSANSLRTQLRIDKLTRLVPWERPTHYQGKYTIKLPLPAGTYSDDTQLTLATTRSMRADGTFDVESFSKLELPVWLLYGLGGGSGTKAAARNLVKKNIIWHNNFYEGSSSQYVKSGGNGAAMRVLPIALINVEDNKRRYSDVWRNTIVTHGHLRGLIGALLMSDAVSSLLSHPPQKLAWLDALIDRCREEYPKLIDIWSHVPEFREWQQRWELQTKQQFNEALREVCVETANQLRIIREHIKNVKAQEVLSQLGCYDRRTKGAGNSTVVAAILFLCRSNDFEDGVISVVNEIGIDTDTIGYFVGAMFGAYYGLESIPKYFRETIQDFDYLLKLADWCYQIYSKEARCELTFKYPDNISNTQIPQNTAFLIDNAQQVRSTIELPVLGSGKLLEEVDITPNWRNNHVHWLKIQLDIGQTVFLQRSHSEPIGKKKSIQFPEQQSGQTGEQMIVASLTILDKYKELIETLNFDPTVITEAIHEIKFTKQDRALYNAFTTWLWAALPKNKNNVSSRVQRTS